MKKLLSFFMAFVMVLSSVLTFEALTDISVISAKARAASYTTGVYRINHYNGVNVRRGAGTGYSRVGAASYGVEFTVTDVKYSGGYTWGYTSSIRCTNGTRSGWLTLNNCKFIRSNATVVPTISFSGMKFTTAFQEGMSKSISGTISSTAPIDSIKADVINATGYTLLSKTVYPNARSYDLAYSTLDYGLKFGTLPTDTYKLCYTVKSGSATEYYNHGFVVIPAAATVTFSNMYFPYGIKYGKSQNISGTISSTHNISKITAEVTNSSGYTVLSASDTPNSKTYKLKYSNLDYSLRFGWLNVGTYKLTYTVTSGSATKTYTHSFAVESERETSWSDVIIAPPSSSETNDIRNRIVETAVQYKNENYSRFCKWYYGYDCCATWCGIYAMYVLNEAGVNMPIEIAKRNNFAWVDNIRFTADPTNKLYDASLGMTWYARGTYTPKPGDLIFFDYEQNNVANHVGIVKEVKNGQVHYIDGNGGYGYDSTRRVKVNDDKENTGRVYSVSSQNILGYVKTVND